MKTAVIIDDFAWSCAFEKRLDAAWNVAFPKIFIDTGLTIFEIDDLFPILLLIVQVLYFLFSKQMIVLFQSLNLLDF
jgi:hypothetical protein